MATYLNAPAYDTYKFRPYELPSNEIAQSIAKRSQQWEIAASQVKSAQQQAAGLSLSRKESKDALNSFMVKAEDQMRKYSRTDLSIAENRQQAMNIFKPLYQDQKLMLDHSITDYYEKQNQLANAAKAKNGGKEFSQNNLNYMNEKYRDFMEDPNYDEATLQKHYNEKRGYTPYYDYRDEFKAIVNSCKPNKYESQKPAMTANGEQSLYFDNISSEGLSQEKLAGCLSAGLSSKAKTQAGIDGYMAYGKNYTALAQDFLDASDSEMKVQNTRKAAMDGAIQGLRDKKNLTEAERLELAQLEQSSNQLGQYIGDQLKTRDLVAGGNEDYIRQNYESIAAPLYLKRQIGEYSKYYSFQDESRKLEENNAAMLMYRTQNDYNQLGMKYNHDIQMNQIEFGQAQTLEGMRQAGRLALAEYNAANGTDASGKATGNRNGLTGIRRVKNADGTFTEFVDTPDVNGRAFADQEYRNSSQIINDRLTTAYNDKKEADTFLFDKFKNMFPQYKTADALIASPEFQNYMKKNPDNGDIRLWAASSEVAGRDIANYAAFKATAEATLKERFPSLFLNSAVDTKGLGSMIIAGDIISPERMVSALKGEDPEIRATGMVENNGITQTREMIYKGKKFKVGNDRRNLQTYQPVFDRYMDTNKRIDEERQKIYGERFILTEKRKDIGNDNFVKNNVFKNRASSALGINPEQFVLTNTNYKGDVWVRLKEGTKESDPALPEDPLETLARGYQVTKEGDLYHFKKVPEYTLFSGDDDHYRDELLHIGNMMELKKGDINRNIPLEIPIRTQKDATTGNPNASYKLVITKGTKLKPYIFRLATKGPDGEYKVRDQDEPSESEAIRRIQELEKPSGR